MRALGAPDARILAPLIATLYSSCGGIANMNDEMVDYLEEERVRHDELQARENKLTNYREILP